MTALGQTLRSLGRQPGLTAAMVLTFALGLGLTGAMFCLVQGATRDLPFPDSQQLIHLESQIPSRGIPGLEVSFHDFLDWRQRQTSFRDLAAYHLGGADLASPGQPPERVRAAFLTANALALLGVAPSLGRGFLDTEEGPGAPRVALLGHSLWRSRFGGDPALVGTAIRIDGEPTVVLGILPEWFRFPLQEEVWLPLRLDPRRLRRGEGRPLEVFGRLRDGVPLGRAREEMESIAGQIALESPGTNTGVGVVVKPFTEEYVPRQVRALLWTMLGAVFGVLLVACVNVANLLLARTMKRSREIAVRVALGADRRRIARQLLGETLVLAALGAAGGLALTALSVSVFRDWIAATRPPFWIRFDLDLPVLVFLAGLTLLAALLAGLAPALRASGQRVHEVLKDEGPGGSGLRPGRLVRALVVGEIAVTFALLAAAGVMVRTVVNLRTVDYGFNPGEVFTAWIALSLERHPDDGERRRFFAGLAQRLEALPGVEAAALGSNLPATPAETTAFALEGRPPVRPGELPSSRLVVVSPGFFAAFGLRPSQGRGFGPEDREDGLPVVLVNEAFRARYLPGESPLGRRVRVGGDRREPWRTVVGVVPDMHLGGPDDLGREGIYLPVSQSGAAALHLVVRPIGGEPLALTAPVRRVVQELDPTLPVDRVSTLAEMIRQRTWLYGVFGTLFLVFGGAALFLAAVGLAGVMSFSVSRRTAEIGTRRALGAQESDIRRMILGQAGSQVAAGMALGLALALPLTRALRHVLFQVSPWDPWTVLAIGAVLVLAALLACLLPLRQAIRVEPLVALRRS